MKKTNTNKRSGSTTQKTQSLVLNKTILLSLLTGSLWSMRLIEADDEVINFIDYSNEDAVVELKIKKSSTSFERPNI